MSIAWAGGVERVIAAMADHGGSTPVQEAGCWALCNLASSNDADKVAERGDGKEEEEVVGCRRTKRKSRRERMK